jgi:hypothetical protein
VNVIVIVLFIVRNLDDSYLFLSRIIKGVIIELIATVIKAIVFIVRIILGLVFDLA